MKTAIICDIDGTLADATHRLHHIQGEGKKDWDSFFKAMDEDGCHENIHALVSLLYQQHAVVFCSGRPEDYRGLTQAWLRQEGFKVGAEFDMPLYMRPSGDFRPDYIIKRDLLDQIRADGFDPWLVIEDRASVVKMWRDAGLTCLQCAEGDF
jgi:uncharacterized HAD superfamily protein